MREIKFRAWNKDKKVMVYDDEDNSSNYLDGICMSDIEFINSSLMENDTYDWMQFTGLHDENGKEIYEGDIVSDNPEWVLHPHHTVTEWDEEKAGWNIDPFSKTEYSGIIIGNIYENPELLK